MELRVRVDSLVAAQALAWSPQLFYLTAPANQQTVDANGNPVIQLYPPYSVDRRGRLPERIELWDLPTRRMIGTVQGVVGNVTLLCSPDGTVLAVSTDLDSAVRLYRVDTRQKLGILGESNPVLGNALDSVRAMAFSPDGTILATGSNDTMVRPRSEGWCRRCYLRRRRPGLVATRLVEVAAASAVVVCVGDAGDAGRGVGELVVWILLAMAYMMVRAAGPPPAGLVDGTGFAVPRVPYGAGCHHWVDCDRWRSPAREPVAMGPVARHPGDGVAGRSVGAVHRAGGG